MAVASKCYPIPGCPLTRGELRAMRLLTSGLPRKRTAELLGLNDRTVRAQRESAFARLGAHDSCEALMVCFNAGWLDPVKIDPDPLRYSDHRVTWAQRLYLEAFGQYLRAWASGDHLDEQRARRLMDDALGGVLGGRMLRHKQYRDPLERLALMVEVQIKGEEAQNERR